MCRTILLFILFGLSTSAITAHPADDLLNHVPRETTVCFVVRDLSSHLKQLKESPFTPWFVETPIGKSFVEMIDPQKAGEFELTLKNQFGLSYQDLIDDIFGEAIVFAYQAGPPEKALILIKPRKVEVAAKFLAKLDEAQKNQIELRSETYRDISFTVRKKKEGGEEAYFIREGILAFTADLASMKSYLDSLADPAAPAPVSASFQRLCALQSFISIWFNPRMFDAAFEAQFKAAAPADRPGTALIGQVWSAVDDFAIQADLTDKLTFRISARLNEKKVPALAQGILPFSFGHTQLWNAIPQDALVAVAGRFAVATALSRVDDVAKSAGQPAVSPMLAKDLRGFVGKDAFQTVLEALGPDWGLWITTPEKTDSWAPDWTFALKIRPDATKKIDTQEAFLEGVNSGTEIVRLLYNQSNDDHLQFKDVTIAGIKVRTINGKKLPVGMLPCYAIKNGYFIFASNPERIAKFEMPAEASGTEKDSPIIRISGSGLRSYLMKHSEAIAATMASLPGQKSSEVKSNISKIIESLEPIEKLEMNAQQDAGITRISIVLTPTKSLKK